ncbi:unnamed protein product [Sphenostylis stenocarpa]|uniref:Uncharacterized protein n=1 Tax=Sphenostylis stenocarpa TaxID=92480 RepID=A0AA86SRZ4_9FABA|nr:unnamed protein product [Sphenostylis stenocarpa]
MQLDKDSGEGPSNRSKKERDGELARHSGMMPVNLLWDKLRITSELALQIDEEIPPVSKLKLRSRNISWWFLENWSTGVVKKFRDRLTARKESISCNQLGTLPVNLLLERSKIINTGALDNFGNSVNPIKDTSNCSKRGNYN